MRMPVSLLLLSSAACATGQSAPATPSRLVVLASKVDERRHDEYRYAPVVRAGSLVFLSGIPAGGADDFEGQVRHMFEEAKRELAAVGATLADVVEIMSFHAQAKDTESFAREFEVINKVHAEYFSPPFPAWTAIGNAVLLSKTAPIEMRFMAVVGSGEGARLERRP